MTNLIRIPARTQAYLTAERDDVVDVFDVTAFEFKYGEAGVMDMPDQIIEMLGFNIGNGYHEVEVPCPYSYVWFDPSKYNGTCQFFFEVVGWNIDTDWESYNPTLDVHLVNSSNTSFASVTLENNHMDVDTYYWYDYYWYRSAAFTPPTEACWLAVRLPDGPNWGEYAVELTAARIVVKQVGASKTRTMVPLMHGWGDGFDNPDESYWKYEPDKMATVATVWFEVNGAGPGPVRLYDVTADAVVPGTTITLTTDPELARIEFSPDDLVAGHLYKFDGPSAWAYAAWLSFELNPCTKFATWYRIGMQSSDCYWDGGRDYTEGYTGYNYLVVNHQRIKLSLPSGSTAYMECTALVGPAGTGFGIGLREDNAHNHDWYGTTLTSDTLTFPGSLEWKRTADITSQLVNDYRYVMWSGAIDADDYAYVLPRATFIMVTK